MNTKDNRQEGGIGTTPKAVILYDRLETMLAANQLLGRLMPRGGQDPDWTVNSWRFDMLQRGGEAGKALGEALDAELILVAIGEADGLWAWPEDWLRRWAVNRKPADGALGLVFVGTKIRGAAESEVVAPLRRMAARQNLKILLFEATKASVGQSLAFRCLPGAPQGFFGGQPAPAWNDRQGSPQQSAEFPQHRAGTGSAAGRLCDQGSQS
jgi:hypothetical protein